MEERSSLPTGTQKFFLLSVNRGKNSTKEVSDVEVSRINCSIFMSVDILSFLRMLTGPIKTSEERVSVSLGSVLY